MRMAECHIDVKYYAKGFCRSCYEKDSKPDQKNIVTCHPDRKHHAKGLCKNCYEIQQKRAWKQSTMYSNVCEKCNMNFVYSSIYSPGDRCRLCPRNNEESKERQKQIKAAWGKKQSEERNWRINNIKLEAGCIDCGYNKHPEALDFDHVNGVKEFSIGRGKKFAWERIEAEIAKCEIVCSNCHRIRTFERRQK